MNAFFYHEVKQVPSSPDDELQSMFGNLERNKKNLMIRCLKRSKNEEKLVPNHMEERHS